MSMAIGKEAREALRKAVAEWRAGRAVKNRVWDGRYALAFKDASDEIEAVLNRCTDAPEVGLPEGFPWTPQVLEQLPLTIREVAHDCGEEDWLTEPIESIARWLDSAGQKESGE